MRVGLLRVISVVKIATAHLILTPLYLVAVLTYPIEWALDVLDTHEQKKQTFTSKSKSQQE